MGGRARARGANGGAGRRRRSRWRARGPRRRGWLRSSSPARARLAYAPSVSTRRRTRRATSRALVDLAIATRRRRGACRPAGRARGPARPRTCGARRGAAARAMRTAPCAAGDQGAAVVDGQHGAGALPFGLDRGGAVELERLAAQRGGRAGPRIRAAHQVAHLARGLVPVDRAVRLAEQRRVAGQRVVLRGLDRRALLDRGQRLDERLGADRGQALGQAARCVVVADRLSPGQEHRAGVHALVELHDGDAGLLLAADDRPLDRRGPAVRGQERRVHVDAALREGVEHGARQDLAVGDDDGEIGVGGAQRLGHLGRAGRARLQHRDAGLLGHALDRRRGEPVPAAGRLVRLGHDQHHAVARDGGAQRRHRELRRAHEDQAKQGIRFSSTAGVQSSRLA